MTGWCPLLLPPRVSCCSYCLWKDELPWDRSDPSLLWVSAPPMPCLKPGFDPRLLPTMLILSSPTGACGADETPRRGPLLFGRCMQCEPSSASGARTVRREGCPSLARYLPFGSTGERRPSVYARAGSLPKRSGGGCNHGSTGRAQPAGNQRTMNKIRDTQQSYLILFQRTTVIPKIRGHANLAGAWSAQPVRQPAASRSQACRRACPAHDAGVHLPAVTPRRGLEGSEVRERTPRPLPRVAPIVK